MEHIARGGEVHPHEALAPAAEVSPVTGTDPGAIEAYARGAEELGINLFLGGHYATETFGVKALAAHLADRFALGAGRRVADFGCGPGLYTTRFAGTGAEVTGIDVSRRSIDHARNEAREQGLRIDYVQANYLDCRLQPGYDLITLIYCDLCPLSPDQRRRLLTTFHDLLADGGSVLLDVFTLQAFA